MTTLRHTLHTLAERSGSEHNTAAFVAERLAQTNPDALLTGLGETGIIALYNPSAPTDTRPLMLRAELDALPIPETPGLPHASSDRATSHRCGHDGHMAALLHLAESLNNDRPARPAILLFQPAEENGTGALAMLADERFQTFWQQHTPERSIAIHNAPGLPLGTIALREGPSCCATTGLAFRFAGSPSHAAEPQHASTPAIALASLIQELADTRLHDDPASVITIAHAYLGEHASLTGPNFGMTPAHATLCLTLRAETTPNVQRLAGIVKQRVETVASAFDITTTETDTFPENTCHPRAIEHARTAAAAADIDTLELDLPFPFGEDFIHLINATPDSDGALIGIGSGEAHPRLHTVGYDFPDELIDPLVRFYRRLLG